VKYFRLKNWDKFQHYKNRPTLSWIRLYLSTPDDVEFATLPDLEKGHLLLVFILAGIYRNRVPFNAELLQNRLHLKEPLNLELLRDKGFIEMCRGRPSSRHRLDSVYQESTLEERRGEKKKKRPKNGRLFGPGLELDWAVRIWSEVYQREPAWSQKEFICLSRAVAKLEAGEDFRERWTAYLACDEPFYQGHPPSKFLSDLEKWKPKGKRPPPKRNAELTDEEWRQRGFPAPTDDLGEPQ
jgi:hypothetical protein